jgi:hypothetical protein
MTNAVSLAQQASTGVSPGFRNRIINGGMVIDQRNAGASLTALNTGAQTYTLDRWAYQASQASKFTIQQNAGSVTPPAGFTNYLGITSSAATSLGAGDYFLINQCIEGFNTADLNWGTANAKTVTLSFWVRSSLTGTFGGSMLNGAQNRAYPFTYTISAASTWEYKTVTVTGDTSGTWVGATSGIGMFISFSLGMGSTYSGTAGAWAGSGFYSATGATSVVGTNGATFYITGVQLEVGSTATSFDYLDYGRSLIQCQRYFNRLNLTDGAGPIGFNDASTKALVMYYYPVNMRANPVVETTGTASNYAIRYTGSTVNLTVVPSFESGSKEYARIACTTGGSLTAGQGVFLVGTLGSTPLSFQAEL